MGIFSKVSNTGSSTDWRVAKKVWAKVNSGWVAATGVFGKTISGWVKMWPGNAPSVRLSDPINIRLGGYNGTVATSPQLFSSTDQGTAGTFLKLWGNDGSFDGVTPITISNRRMLCSDNIDGQVERFSLSGNDTIDFSTTSQATRDLAEGYYIFYQLLATNVDGSLDAYSPPIKVIKREPALVSYTVLSKSGGALQGQSGFSSFDVIELNAQIRWGWWIKPGGYLGGTPVLRWWKNTSKSPGGTLLKEINIETGYDYVSGSYDSTYLSDTNTSNVLTIYSNYGVSTTPLQAGQYIVAELYLENSYTAHYSAPVSYWGSTGATPTLTSVSLRTYDGQVDTVMDNQSDPRIVSQTYFEIVAQVADYEIGTTFNFEPRIYKADTGIYLNYDSGATISGGFPTDVSPYSVSQSGTSATVIWRTYINSNFLTGSPTYGGGQAKYWFEFRLSATKSGGSTSYYTGTVSSNHSGNTIFPTYMFGSSGGSIYIHPHTQSVLSANNYTVGSAPQTIRFSVTGDSYPSGYASYPRSYGIDFGDGTVENIAWPTGTSNPSYTTWDHTYTTNGAFTARLITVPQGFTNIGTRERVINVGASIQSPTSLTATTDRTDGVNLTFGGSSNATGYNIFWNTSPSANPINNVTQGDFLNKTSPFLDTTIGSGVTRWYWVQARGAISDGYSTGVSPWYPVGNGVTGTRQALAAPTITSLSASAPSTTSSQLVTVTVSWNSTNQSSFSCSVTQTGVASYTKYGSTETSANQSSSGSFFNVYSGASATILLRVYNGPPDSNGFPTGTYAESTITYTPPISLSKLSTPTGVNATDDRSDGVNVTWNPVSGAAYYGVWWGGAPAYDSLADFGGNRNVNLITGTSYLDTAISAGSSRDYYVQAYRSGDPSGTKSDWGGPNNGTRVNAVVITYGPCEYWYENTTYECSGTFNRNVTTTYYRRKIYVNGSWDGSNYDTSGCSSSTTYGSYQLTNGRCGHVDAPYQYYCRTNYYQSGIPDDTYIASSDESAVVCESYRTVCSFNNTGSYPSASNPPACPTTTWYCTESYPGGGVGNCGYSTYTYNNSASGSGYSRSCSTSGYPSCQSTNPATPVCISYKYVCKYYDAYNSASNNYFTCYYEGECAANNNSDGSRSTCCAAYS